MPGSPRERASGVAQKSAGRPGLKYEAVQKLGEGAFGVAHLVKDKLTGEDRVLKTINKRRSQVPPAELEREIRNMKACDHPHIVRLLEYYEDYENIYLIMERAAGGELQQVLQVQNSASRHLPERWVATVLKQCLQAINYVHSKGIIHKDLKSENILLLFECNVNDPKSVPHAVIIDLGIGELFTARLGRRARCSVVAGTPTHMAPEVWRGNFGPVADVWSLGVVLFELLSGEVPFLCSSLNSAAEWVRLHKKGPNWQLLSHCSAQARAFCQRMLSCDDRMRPTAQQCLGHAWFKEPDGAAVGDFQDSVAPGTETEEASRSSAASGAGGGREESSSAAGPRLESAMAGYAERSRYEKAVMLEVASWLHTEQVFRVANAFLSADVDRSGTILLDELVQRLQELGVEICSAEAYAQCCEADGNGRIDYTELAAGCIDVLYESLRGLLWQSFCEIDVDGKGLLGPAEVRAVVTRLDLAGHGFPGCEDGGGPALDEAISKVRVDSSGQISFDELCNSFLPARPLLPERGRAEAASKFNDEEFEQLLDHIEAQGRSDTSFPAMATSLPPQDLGHRPDPRPDSGLSELLEGAVSPEPDAMMARLEGEQLARAGKNSSPDVDEELSHLLAEMSGNT